MHGILQAKSANFKTSPVSQATWSIGQRVKIRSVSAEEAEGVQSSGPAPRAGWVMQSFDKMTCVHRKFGASSADVTISGWDSSMAQHLGEIKEITDFRAGRCELEGEWWMLGLLEACDGRPESTSDAESDTSARSVGFLVGERKTCCVSLSHRSIYIYIKDTGIRRLDYHDFIGYVSIVAKGQADIFSIDPRCTTP